MIIVLFVSMSLTYASMTDNTAVFWDKFHEHKVHY
jgi:hypothetical protein